MGELDRELDRIRRQRDAAGARAAAEGRDPLVAAMQESLAAGLPDLQRNVPRLAEALGREPSARLIWSARRLATMLSGA